MAPDWSGRDAALKYYEHELKIAKRHNSEDKELVEEAVNALRRSQDHTAIQNRLKEATNLLRNAALCDHPGSGLCQQCRDSIQKFVSPPEGKSERQP
jgi:hypothetical protein